LRRVLGRLAVGVVGRGNGPIDDKREKLRGSSQPLT
jgi:hypothetical protein